MRLLLWKSVKKKKLTNYKIVKKKNLLRQGELFYKQGELFYKQGELFYKQEEWSLQAESLIFINRESDSRSVDEGED